MRHLLASAAAIVLLACGSPAPPGDRSVPRDASTPPTVDSLMTWAATDFRRQRSPRPVRFRAVRSGYLATSGGARQYRLCGEYSPASEGGDAEWIPFATIQTSPYEQWIGDQALTFCRDAQMTWDDGDLSARLLGRLGSVR